MDREPSASHRAKSESPSTTASASSVVHRTSTAPTTTTSSTIIAAPWTTAVMNPWTTPVTSASSLTSGPTVTSTTASGDMTLMSTLLHALRNYSTTTTGSSGCHGSPVMILKDLIDKHFSEAAAVASSPVSPVHNPLHLNTVALASHVCYIILYYVFSDNMIKTVSFETTFKAVSRQCIPG